MLLLKLMKFDRLISRYTWWICHFLALACAL